MDWSKAKNILIIAFIITNIFLLFNIRYKSENKDYFYEVNKERIEDTIQILKDKDIIVKADVPEETPKLSVLTVEYEAYNTEEMAKKFLGEYKIQNDQYVNKNESIRFMYNNKLLIYEQRPEWFRTEELTKEKAKERSDSFIKKYGFMDKDVEVSDISETDDNIYTITYGQKYNNMFLEDSYMKVVVDNVRVREFERKWLNPRGVKTHKEKVIPSTTALLMSIGDIKERIGGNYDEAVITEMSLGYLLDISKFDSLIKWYDMETGDASPYWRITLEDKDNKLKEKHIFIEAYQ